MEILKTAIPEVILFKPRVFSDSRGFFFESFNERVFATLGLLPRFVQDNHSGSRKNVIRGLHYQIQQPQGKLVRVLFGAVFDVAVDLRRGSPTFGKWVGQILSDQNRHMLWIPPGFAHGFLALSDWVEVAYKATEFYAPSHERTVVWNDPDLAIAWPIEGTPLLAEKDALGRSLREAETYNETIAS